jgi:hypothetical protein
MVTTVGTESDVTSLLEDLVHLDHDAAAAYQSAIDRLEDQRCRRALQDERRHCAWILEQIAKS